MFYQCNSLIAFSGFEWKLYAIHTRYKSLNCLCLEVLQCATVFGEARALKRGLVDHVVSRGKAGCCVSCCCEYRFSFVAVLTCFPKESLSFTHPVLSLGIQFYLRACLALEFESVGSGAQVLNQARKTHNIMPITMRNVSSQNAIIAA